MTPRSSDNVALGATGGCGVLVIADPVKAPGPVLKIADPMQHQYTPPDPQVRQSLCLVVVKAIDDCQGSNNG